MKDFYNDTYAKSIECVVTNINTTDKFLEVYTDKTICYPECGGQPGDKGKLGNIEILDTKKSDNGDSIHILSKDSEISIGDKLTMSLDWDHRYKFMVMHTAQHMLSGMLFNMFNIGTVSVHLGDDYLTIETNKEEIEQKTIDELVLAANDKISEAHKIIYHEMSHADAEALGMRRSIKVDGDVRIVEIEGIDRIACGGVHVSSTSELRLVVYLGQQKIRDHVRLLFVCGKDAQRMVYENKTILDNLKNMLSCSNYEELISKTEKNAQQLTKLKQFKKEVSETLAKHEIENNIHNSIAVFETKLELDSIPCACESYEDLALCVINENNWMIVLKGKYKNMDFNLIREKVLSPCNAKGGGKDGFYRGSCTTGIIDKFKSLF